MSPGVPTKVIASSCGLAGFAVATLAGMFAANPADSVLIRALLALAACYIVGTGVGLACERTIARAITDYKHTRPVAPSDDAGLSMPRSAGSNSETVLVV